MPNHHSPLVLPVWCLEPLSTCSTSERAERLRNISQENLAVTLGACEGQIGCKIRPKTMEIFAKTATIPQFVVFRRAWWLSCLLATLENCFA